MSGFITKKECRECKDFIVEKYGEEFYKKCLECEGMTFLSLLVREGKI